MAGQLATAVLALSAIAIAVAPPAASVPCPGPPGLTVDLGYGVYQGVLDNTTGLESWKGYVRRTNWRRSWQGERKLYGSFDLRWLTQLCSSVFFFCFSSIRYAAAPVGSLRWKAPQPPPVNRTLVVADAYAPRCPQALNAGSIYPLFPGDEDCLFVNVWRPSPTPGQNWGADGLPVMVYIHGGGYGLGNGAVDMTAFLNSTSADIVIVAFQYRVSSATRLTAYKTVHSWDVP